MTWKIVALLPILKTGAPKITIFQYTSANSDYGAEIAWRVQDPRRWCAPGTPLPRRPGWHPFPLQPWGGALAQMLKTKPNLENVPFDILICK